MRAQREMRIAEERYAAMAAAITEALQPGKKLLYTKRGKREPELLASVSWYLIAAVRDLQSQGKVV